MFVYTIYTQIKKHNLKYKKYIYIFIYEILRNIFRILLFNIIENVKKHQFECNYYLLKSFSSYKYKILLKINYYCLLFIYLIYYSNTVNSRYLGLYIYIYHTSR